MRKILAALLVVTLILPLGVHAAPEDYPTTASFDPALAGNPEQEARATEDATARRVEELTKAGDSLGCGQAGEFGGAMSNALDNALKGLIGSVIGQVKGKVGDLINEIGAKAGPLRPLVDFAARKILPELDKQLNKLGESLVKDLGLGDTLSGVGKALGVDLGGVASALGVSIPGLGALPIPGIGGGLAVPVVESGKQLSEIETINKLTKIIEEHSNKIKQATGNSTYVTCVLNPAFAEARNGVIEELSKAQLEWVTQGNDGNPIFVQNLPAQISQNVDANIKSFIEKRTAPICSSFRQDVQRIITTQWMHSKNYGARVQCAGARNGEQPGVGVPSVTTWWGNLFKSSNSPIGVLLESQDKLNQIAADTTVVDTIEYNKNQGFYNKCQPKEGSREYDLNCIIATHGTTHAEALNNVLDLGNQQLVQADEIGELITELMQGLQGFAFQNLEGLLGLAGNEEGGSYLDELVGSNTDDSLSKLQGVLASDIRGALTTEQAYLAALELVIKDLETARTSYTEVISCYQPLTTAGSPTITATTAREVVDLASTTIRSALTPQLSELYIEQANSETSIEELTSLLDQAQSVLTLTESVTVSNSFTALKESGLMHNATDLEYLVQGLDASANTIETLLQDARLKLTACKGI